MYKIRKIMLGLLASTVLSTPVVAQVLNVSTGPNKVFIEQLGNTNTVTIEQVGGSNTVGGTASIAASNINYATITGSANTLTLTQQGDNNLGQYNIKGNDNIYVSAVTGNGNQSKLSVGDIANNNNLRNNINEAIAGDDNTVVQNIIGNDITSKLIITGNSNQVTKDLKSTLGFSDVTIIGSSNRLDIEQFDVAGGVGHSLTQAITGDFNSIMTQQQGTNDTIIDIKVGGDHNTVTVRTSSAAIIAPRAAVIR